MVRRDGTNVLIPFGDKIIPLDANTYWSIENNISVCNPLLYLVTKGSHYKVNIFNLDRKLVKTIDHEKNLIRLLLTMME